MRGQVAILVLLVLLARVAPQAVGAGVAPESGPSAVELFNGGNEKFRQAAGMMKDDPRAAKTLLGESVAHFRALIDSGVVNGKIYYNIGNAYALAGDVGRAILNYRRAERLIPGDTNLLSNLRVARDRTRDRIPVATSRRAMETLLFWHYDIPTRARWWAFAAAFDLAWLAALVRLFRAGAPRWPIVAFGVIAALLAGSLLVERAQVGADPEGVIVSGEVVGRKGPDASGYEASFKEPLHAGVEFRAAERRGAWVLARLSDGRETWLPDASVEMVDEALR